MGFYSLYIKLNFPAANYATYMGSNNFYGISIFILKSFGRFILKQPITVEYRLLIWFLILSFVRQAC